MGDVLIVPKTCPSGLLKALTNLCDSGLWWVDLMVDLVNPVVDQCRVHLVMVWWVMPGEAAGGFLSSRAEGAVVQGEFRCEFLVPWFLGGKTLLPKRSMSSSRNSSVFLLLSLILSYCHIVILSTCHPVILSPFYFFFIFSGCHPVILSNSSSYINFLSSFQRICHLVSRFVILPTCHHVDFSTCQFFKSIVEVLACQVVDLSPHQHAILSHSQWSLCETWFWTLGWWLPEEEQLASRPWLSDFSQEGDLIFCFCSTLPLVTAQ